MSHSPVIEDAWTPLREFTAARIALGRAGVSLSTRAHLAFQLDHARARDAVWSPLDPAGLTQRLSDWPGGVLSLRSQATDRATYLRRPDLGRRLHPDDADHLEANPMNGADVALILADGLSPQAVNRQAPLLAKALRESLQAQGFTVSPLCLVQQGRVAIADEIGALLHARLSLILIGERPGLSAPESLGAYLTFAPRDGRTDAERNCVSNIREGGLSIDAATITLLHLIGESLRRGLSGVALKDDQPSPRIFVDADQITEQMTDPSQFQPDST